jgi:hypothetical protein
VTVISQIVRYKVDGSTEAAEVVLDNIKEINPGTMALKFGSGIWSPDYQAVIALVGQECLPPAPITGDGHRLEGRASA